MEGRYPKGNLVVTTAGPGEAEDQAFNDWYTRVHVPDVVATGWVVKGIMYRNVRPVLEPREARYLAIFETDRWDMEDMVEELPTVWRARWEAQGTYWGGAPVTYDSSVFRLCGPPLRPEASAFTTEKTGTAPVTGLVLAWAICTQPEREMDFNNWFNRRYVPELMSQAPFHTAYRYASAFRNPDGRRVFLTIYETDEPNPESAGRQFLDGYESPVRTSPLVQELGYSIYRPI